MRPALAFVAVVALFVLGVAVGALGTNAFYLRQWHEPNGLAARLVAADLRRNLDLSAAQKAQLDAILRETRDEALALRREFLPRFAALLDRTQQKVEAMLTPEQRQAYQRYRERRGDRLKRFLLLRGF